MKTDLEKSHSKLSNFKLTLLILLVSIFFPSLFLVLFFKVELESLFYYILSALIIINVILLFMIRRFKR